MSQIGSPALTPTSLVSVQENDDEGNGNAVPREAGTPHFPNKRNLDSSCVAFKAVGRPPKVARYDLPCIEASILHQNCKSWVVFSDLHVKGDSIDTCEKVLSSVHQAAVNRQGGVIFLGDFWHVRRSLDVELLNRVLDVLRRWTCPVIMIPGNHDQVTLGGKVHSLKPLQSAFQLEQMLIIDEPAICMGALWVPYRRDLSVLRAVLRAGAATPGISMIFCHADVKGAFMNDNMRSKEGLDISSFPINVPIYSGHFHKPHTICEGRTTLRYVGSPYQTSLAEAGQEKYFYCVQRGNHGVSVGVDTAARAADTKPPETWKEVERWVCNIGRKIFRASSPTDSSITVAEAGDRVVVTVPTGQEYAARVLQAELQERGIEVELKPEDNPLMRRRKAAAANAASNDVVPAEDMDPLCLFRSFMNQLSSNPDLEASLDSTIVTSKPSDNTAINALHVKVREEGLLTLQRLQDGTKTNSGGCGREKLLRFETVTLSNFGPYFGDKVIEYPLSNRGLVLIKGQSTDGTGADSNGAGKTTLAMSVLWCLAGCLDTRVAGDGKVADVTFDSNNLTEKKIGKSSTAAPKKLTAEVIVKGTINSLPFEVIRRRCGAKSELHFFVNGKCLTRQTVPDTQALINDHLGIKNGLLQRCCFFGQHSLESLLRLTDVKLKQELSALVDTSLWVAAEKDMRGRCKDAQARLIKLQAQNEFFKVNLVRAEVDLVSATNKLQVCEEALLISTKEFDAIPAPVISIADLNQDLTTNKAQQAELVQGVLEPLKAAALTAQQHHDSKCAEGDQTIVGMKVEVTKLEAEKAASIKSIQIMQKRRQDLQAEKERIDMQAKPVQEEVAVARESFKVSSSNTDSSFLHQLYERSLLESNAVVVRIKDMEASFALINSLHMRDSCGQDESCPTCGQEMPEESRVGRIMQLRTSLDTLHQEKELLSQRSQGLHRLWTNSALLESLNDKISDLQKLINDVNGDILSHTILLDTLSEKLMCRARDLNHLQLEMASYREAFLQQQQENARALAETENHLAMLRAEASVLQDTINNSHQQENTRQRALNEVALAQQRVSSADCVLQEKAAEQVRIQEQLTTSATDHKELTDQETVFKRLIAVLGKRGMQNFIFQNVILQLECIANAYLEVLSEGGIQLALQCDGADESRIVKSVWVRSKESVGEYRERGLATLSGGQWRRVSLALDFAFAELIRRRGMLRSNLMVMDEVLTHLDASGRESVGIVLRAMLQGPSPHTEDGGNELHDAMATSSGEEARRQQRMTDVLLGGGAYETVVIILQDLAAAELSESFDHVDVVVKESDRSTVVLDGEEI